MSGLGWVHKLVDWVGLGKEKWTHVHLCILRHHHRHFYVKISNTMHRIHNKTDDYRTGNSPTERTMTNEVVEIVNSIICQKFPEFYAEMA